MALHLIKLCVGCDSVADLSQWIDSQLAERRRLGEPAVHVHRTRQMPKKRDEILDGGSLYWVIKGQVMVRERIVDLAEVKDANGVPHCDIVLSGDLVQVEPRACRPFQGWRYLADNETPRDIPAVKAHDLSPELWRELATLGLL